jgi:hypothetical protein
MSTICNHEWVEVTVRKREAVGNGCYCACREIVAVYLISQSWRGAEILEKSIESISKVKVAVARTHDQVVK